MLQQAGALGLLWLIYLLVNFLRFEGTLSAEAYVETSVLLLASAFLEFFTRTRESRQLAGLAKDRLASVSHRQTLFALVIVFGTMVMLKDDRLSRVFLTSFFVSYFLWISWTNLFGFRMLHRALYRDQEKGLARTLLIGSPTEVNRFCNSTRSPQPPGTDILGFIPVGSESATLAFPLPCLGDLTDLRTICEQTRAKVILLLGLHSRKDLVTPLTNLSSELGLRSMWIEDVRTQFGHGFQPYHTNRFSVVSPFREPLEDPTNRFLKRCTDLFLSSIAILLVLPPAILIARFLQAQQSPGPLFYRQERSGRNGEAFQIFKFRSMHAEPEAKFEQAREDDPRIFKGGQWMRRYSIDELPQLLNVFRGEMSLVGPRPHPVSLDEYLHQEDPSYRMRTLAKPGLTGLAQSRGWRGETRDDSQLRNRIRLDLFYIQNWSLSFDIRIMIGTIAQVFKPPRSAR